MTDTTSTPPPPAAGTPPSRHAREAGIFRWARGLGIVRGDRWIAGVCGGLAARLGIDPLIVRGMFVVAALIGFPAVLVYIVCWLLLPDLQGRIPLQQLARSGAGPFVITLGALGIAVFGMLFLAVSWRNGADFSFMFGGWWWQFLGLYGLGQFLTAVFWVALAVGAIVMLVKLSPSRRKAPGGATTPLAPGPARASGASTPPPDGVPASYAPVTPAGPDGATAPSDLSPESVEQWRIRQEEWHRQYDDWRQQQTGADAAAKEQIRREREERGRAFAMAAQERAAWRRRTKPRTSALSVLGVIGAALVGGAITALTVAHLGALVACGAALLVAAIVCATGMAVAGILRRRSGFLAFVASALLVIGLIVGYLGVMVPDGFDLSVSTSVTPQSYRQAFGTTTVTVVPTDPHGVDGVVSIDKYAGTTIVSVMEGASVDVDALLGDGSVTVESVPAAGGDAKYTEVRPTLRSDAGSRFTWTGPAVKGAKPPTAPAHVRVDQRHGSVLIEVTEERK